MRLVPSPPRDLTPRECRWFDAGVIGLGVGGGGTLAGLLAGSPPCTLAGFVVALVAWAVVGILLLRAQGRESRRRVAELETRRRESERRHAEERAALAQLRRELDAYDRRGGRS